MAVSNKWSGNIKSGNQKSLRLSFSSRNLNSVKSLPDYKDLIFKEFKYKLGESREDLFVSTCRYAVEKSENHFVRERENRSLGKELLQKAKYCFSVNQMENAWKYLYQSLRVFPSCADSHDFIAGCYESDGKTFPAMKHFRIAKALRKFYALPQKKQVWYNNPLGYDHNIKWQFEALEANSSQINSRFNICFPVWLNPFRKLIAASFLWICFLLGGEADAIASEAILKTKEIVAESDTLLRLFFQNRYEEGVDGSVNLSRLEVFNLARITKNEKQKGLQIHFRPRRIEIDLPRKYNKAQVEVLLQLLHDRLLEILPGLDN